MVLSGTSYKAIDALRGISALLIIFHHLLPMAGYQYNWDFGNTIVLFFFVLSGFHLTLGWKDKIEKPGACRKFLIKRCSKIFPIQWGVLALYLILGINIVSWWAVPFHFLLIQSIVPFWEINFSLYTPSWFLSAIFICYLFTPFLLKKAIRDSRKFILVWISVVLLFHLMLLFKPNEMGTRWLVYINPASRLLDFSMGVVLALYWQRIKDVYKMNSIWNGTFLEVIAIGGILVWMSNVYCISLNDYKVLRYPFVCFLIIAFSLQKGMVSRIFSNRFLSWLGSISFSVYMLHGFAIFLVSRYMCASGFCAVVGVVGVTLLFSHIASFYILPKSVALFESILEKLWVSKR